MTFTCFFGVLRINYYSLIGMACSFIILAKAVRECATKNRLSFFFFAILLYLDILLMIDEGLIEVTWFWAVLPAQVCLSGIILVLFLDLRS